MLLLSKNEYIHAETSIWISELWNLEWYAYNKHDCENFIEKWKGWKLTPHLQLTYSFRLKQQFLGIICSYNFLMKKLTAGYAPRHFNVQNLNWIKWENFVMIFINLSSPSILFLAYYLVILMNWPIFPIIGHLPVYGSVPNLSHITLYTF